MAQLIKVDGQTLEVHPKNGTYFELHELYSLLGCHLIDIIELYDGRQMVIDDEGKLSENWQINLLASELFREGRMPHHEYKEHLKKMSKEKGMFFIDATSDSLDVIAGDVLVAQREEIR